MLNLDSKYRFIVDTVIKTRDIALKDFNKGRKITSTCKIDGSPVTQTDLAINNYLISSFIKEFPDWKIISEENDFTKSVEAINSEKSFIIDPLDGTSAFIKGIPEFTVNGALKVGDIIVFSVI